MKGYVKSLIGAKASTIGLKVATAALNTALSIGISAAISGLIALFVKLINAKKEAREKAIELANAYKDQSSTLDSQIKKYKELSETLKDENLSVDENLSIKKQLADLQEDLIKSYGEEATNIDIVNGKYQEQLNLLENLSKEKAREYVSENKGHFEDAKDELEKKRSYSLGDVAYWDNYNTPKTQKDESLIEFLKSYSDLFRLYDINLGAHGIQTTTVELGIVANAEEAYETLHQFYYDLEQFGKENDIDVSSILESVSNKRASILTDELKEYREIYDEYANVLIMGNDNLRPAYKDAIEYVEKFNSALKTGEGYTEAKNNLESLRDSLNGLVADLSDSDKEAVLSVFDKIFANQKKSRESEIADLKKQFGLYQYDKTLETFFSSSNVDIERFKEIASVCDTATEAIRKYNEERNAQVVADSAFSISEEDAKKLSDYQSKIDSISKALKDYKNLGTKDIMALMQEFNGETFGKIFEQFGVTGEQGVGYLDSALKAIATNLKNTTKSTVPQMKKAIDEIFNSSILNPQVEKDSPIDWLTASLEKLQEAVDDANRTFENAKGIDAQKAALSKLNTELGNLKIGYQAASDEYGKRYRNTLSKLAENGVNTSLIKQKIEAGDVINTEYFTSDVAKLINEAIDNYNNQRNADNKLVEIGVKIDKNSIEGLNIDFGELSIQREILELQIEQEESVEEKKNLYDDLSKIVTAYYNTQIKIANLQGKISEATKLELEKQKELKQIEEDRNEEKEKSSIDWLGNSLDNVEEKLSDLNRELENSKGFDNQRKALEKLNTATENAITAYSSASVEYNKRYLDELSKLSEYNYDQKEIQKKIEAGDIFNTDEFPEEVAEIINTAIEYWKDKTDADNKVIELGVSFEENSRKSLESYAEESLAKKQLAESKLDVPHTNKETLSIYNELERRINDYYNQEIELAKLDGDKNKIKELQLTRDKELYDLNVKRIELSSEEYSSQQDILRLQIDQTNSLEERDKLYDDLLIATESYWDEQIKIAELSKDDLAVKEAQLQKEKELYEIEKDRKNLASIDWMDNSIKNLDKKVSDLENVFSNTTGITEQLKALDELNKGLEDLSGYYSSFIIPELTTRYSDALSKAAEVGLNPDDIKKKVEAGDIINIESFTDEQSDAIQKVIDAFNALGDAENKVTELGNKAKDNINQLPDLIITEFDRQLAVFESQTNMIESRLANAESRGLIATQGFYKALKDVELDKIGIKQDELVSLQTVFNSNEIEKGSDKWYELRDNIESVKLEILEAENAIANFDNKMRQVDWDLFDFARNQESKLMSEADFMIDLLDSAKLFSDAGEMTAEGLATLGLHAQNYNSYLEQSIDYAKELAEIQKKIDAGSTDTKVIERRNELLELQQESILSSEAEKDAMISLVEEGINLQKDAFQELITEYEKTLDLEKDIYDYQKKNAQQTRKIADIQKQLSSLQGDNSDEAKAKKQQLQKELKTEQESLQDQQYDRYLSDQKEILSTIYDNYEEALDNYLENTAKVISDSIYTVNKNATTIGKTLAGKTSNVGYDVTNEMDNIWKKENLKLGEGFNDVSENVSTGNGTLSEIKADNNQLITEQKKEIVEAIKNLDSSDSIANKTAGAIATNTNSIKLGILNIIGLLQTIAEKNLDKKNYEDASGGFVSGVMPPEKDYIVHMPKKGYASGGYNLKKQLAWTQEDGTEYIIRPSDGAILTPLAKGDSVLTSEATKNLWNMANNPMDFIKDNLSVSIPNIPTVNGNGTVDNNIQMTINLPGVTNYQEFVTRLQSDKKFEKMIVDVTSSALTGSNSLSKYRHKF